MKQTVLLFLLIISGSCSPYTPTNQVEITESRETIIVNSPSISASPNPTSTIAPAVVATYTPIAPDVPVVAQVLRSDSFDELGVSMFNLYIGENGTFQFNQGVLVASEPVASDLWADGSTTVALDDQSIKEGNGYLLLFRSQPEAYFIVEIGWGAYGQEDYRSFWLQIGQSLAFSVSKADRQLLRGQLGFDYKPDTWHYLLLWIDSDTFYGRIWERDNPDNAENFEADLGAEWMPLKLNYAVNVAKGIVEIDNFQELEFEK